MSNGTVKAVHYCYECGRRLNTRQDHCWYCNAPVREYVRPPKRCPFCGEAVRAEAVKCKHCGEFIDGRPRPAEGPRQVIFVVDKDLLRAGQDLRLMAGQSVPPEVARVLGAPTVRAIESGQPALIQAPGVRALPAPGPGEPLEVEAREVDADELSEGGLQRSLIRSVGGGAPARSGGGASAGGALGGLIKWKPKPAPKAAADPNTFTAEAHDLYRVCERCGAEILVSDNYCYHCRMQFHKTRADAHRQRKFILGYPAKVPYVLALAAAALLWVYQSNHLTFPWSWAPLALAGAGAALIALGLARGRGVLNWLAAAVTGAALLAVLLGFFS